MSAKTKIIVLKMKELIYTAVFVGLAILLIAIGWAMFHEDRPTADPQSEKTPHTDSQSVMHTSTSVDPYIPGVYTASLPLGSKSLDVEVVVDSSQIKNIRLIHLEESVAAMYPLVTPTLESLRTQILASQSTEGISYEEHSKYTAYVLLQAVEAALAKAFAN